VEARIYFSNGNLSNELDDQRKKLWGESNIALQWLPEPKDIIFIAGMDWQFVLAQKNLKSSMPKINLIQGVRHADPLLSLYQYLSEPAIRICVSQQVADAIKNTRRVNGPVFVIPNGVDIDPVPSASVIESPISRVQIVGYKQPEFARDLNKKLLEQGIETEMLLQPKERTSFIQWLDLNALIVCCPLKEEGFYLSGLEAMAKGCLVVVPDCIGNRAYARNGINSFLPDYDLDSVVGAVKQAMNLSQTEVNAIRSEAIKTAAKHSLHKERSSFYKMINDVDQLWQEISS
jgi:hypothetical protein